MTVVDSVEDRPVGRKCGARRAQAAVLSCLSFPVHIAGEGNIGVKFSDIVDQARGLLQRKGRISYRALKLEFELDDEQLDVLKEELIDAERVASDEDGKILVWSGDGADPPAPIPQPRPAVRPTVQPTAAEGERRQLTVMFCDLVGSTALSEQLDPEDLHTIVRTYQDACRQVIERYEGHIAQYLGDGILVYFGYPAAHEDDAIRGVRAGLDILTVLPTLELARPIQARIGLHTGPVVIGAVGSGDHTEQLALGETPNIAARVQGKAAPDTVAISADTYRLIQGFFTCDDLGPQDLKGLSSSLKLYQVTGEGEAQNRFDVSVQQGLTPLVGREEEVELLLRRWERAKAGQGQVVLLSGEAGIGKSRLVQVLRDHSRNEPHLSILCRCSPFYQNSALYPIIDRMQQVLEFTKADTAETKLTKLTQSLEPVDMTDEESVALFATLLSIPLPETHLRLQYSPQKQKEKTLQALVTWLHKTAVQKTVRLEFEDLHWADPSTLELLGLLIDQAPTSRLLILLTFRPEFTSPWPGHAHMLSLQLNRLPQQEIAAIVERVAGKTLPEEVVQQLLTKSDGVPLYIEEMTKNLVESGLLTETDGHYELTGPLPDMAIPSSLQDSFAARLDRLASVRELAQIGAVLGRDFTYDLIHAVSRMDDAKLQDGLGQLSAADILFQRGVPPDAAYTFKHALLQDAAYQSLLKSQRQQFHARTAQVLQQQFPETKDTHPELLAHHYTEASLAEQAISYWQQAGQRATQQFGNAEAITHLTTGLEILKTLPESRERAQHELQFHMAVSAPVLATTGFASPELERTFERAYELCQQLGETPERFGALMGVWLFHLCTSELQTSLTLAEQFLRLAQEQDDATVLQQAHLAMTNTLFYIGDLTTTRMQIEQGMALDAAVADSFADLFGLEMVSGLRLYAAFTWWLLGYPEQALQWSMAAVTRLQAQALPFNAANVLELVALFHVLRREAEITQEHAEASMTLATEHGFPQILPWSSIHQGWALGEQGRPERGLERLGQGLTLYRASGLMAWQPFYLGLLAQLHGQVGCAEEALSVLAEAQQISTQRGEFWCEAELHRLQGALLLQQSPNNATEAEACFQQAIEVAHNQKAKSWELRAATSLARLWQQQDKKEEARELLAPVYDWFTEGFDTADLKDAKALLDQLS